jgi:hypothetical protein
VAPLPAYRSSSLRSSLSYRGSSPLRNPRELAG